MRSRLSVMMALVYAVQGAFVPVLAIHLKDLGVENRARGWIFATLAIGSMAMPLGAGQLVDRCIAGQRMLAMILVGSACFLMVMASGWVTSSWGLFALFLAFWLVTAPATSLSSAIALRHLPKPYEQFPGVRLWGTAGWMAVGWFVTLVLALWGGSARGQGAFAAFGVAAALALVLAWYAWNLLPDTPPLFRPEESGRGGLREGLALAFRPGMLAFLTTAFVLHLTTPFIYQILPTYLETKGLSRSWIPTAMTMGQWPEMASLAILPWMFRRLGVRGTLAVGIAAWACRFGMLALHLPLWGVILSIPLHGVGMACFTIAGQLFMDSAAPDDRRATAQAVYTVVTAGIGSLLGSVLAGDVMERLGGDERLVFLVPCVIDFALLVYFCAGFRPNSTTGQRTPLCDAARPFGNDAVRGTFVRVGTLLTESADG
jgi:MFS family permease